MTSLFSTEGRKALKRLKPGRSLIALDFDGTLAPLVDRASRARTPIDTRKILRNLMKLTEIAVISGRSLKDLKRRLGFTPQYMIGNHGLEGPGASGEAKHAARLAKLWSDQLGPRQDLENKFYSLTLHYRLANDRGLARNRLRREIALLDPPPRVVAGKCVFNLVSDQAPHKGDALAHLLDRTGVEQALFIGDDDTDEDIFRMKDRRLITVRVGASRKSAARFSVRRQEDVGRILKQLLHEWSQPSN